MNKALALASVGVVDKEECSVLGENICQLGWPLSEVTLRRLFKDI